MDHPLAPVLDCVPPPGGEGSAPARAARIDLHCHSTFSRETLSFLPGLVFHPVLPPDELYDLAKRRRMDYVTITDHDTIDGCLDLLARRGPLPDFILGEELSAAFPEDGTIVHVNVFGLDENDHRELQRLRGNLYDVAHYCRARGMLFVLNHMTWTQQHRVLKRWQIEAMLAHFDVFEALNGARSFAHNALAWAAASARSKTLVGGSDSHTRRVGTTYTLSRGATAPALLDNIRAGLAEPCGAFGTPEKLREDVWLVFQREIERRLAQPTTARYRMVCRTMRRLMQWGHPLACLGYYKRQNALVEKFLQALPA